MNRKYCLEMEPVDTLFFRDARPMQAGAGSGGHGANWPLPTVIHESVRSALLRQLGPLPVDKSIRGHMGKSIATRDFESLRVIGPFPSLEGRVYFPTPSDLVPNRSGRAALMTPIQDPVGVSNLPCSWLHPAGFTVRSGKEELPRWVDGEKFSRLLSPGNGIPDLDTPDLWYSENRIGIRIDPKTRRTIKGLLYTSEHLRPRDGLRLTAEIFLGEKAPEKEREALDDLIRSHLLLGGESRMCRISKSSSVPTPEKPNHGKLIKWVLATPALFREGWRPNWVNADDGRIFLKHGNTRRHEGENRREWRQRIRRLPEIRARLVAVCSPKPAAFSGWDVARNMPKTTRLAVPAGSVFYFEADSEEEAAALVDALHGRTLSDFFGEKGMGLGFCGTWKWIRLFNGN